MIRIAGRVMLQPNFSIAAVIPTRLGLWEFANSPAQWRNAHWRYLRLMPCGTGSDAPPVNPNHPTWANIHPTIGNQYLNVGKLFSAHLSPHDPRYQVFQTWTPGTVDTTAIENDHINNPGIITQFFNFPDRPYFDLTQKGLRFGYAAQVRAAKTILAVKMPRSGSFLISACAPKNAWSAI